MKKLLLPLLLTTLTPSCIFVVVDRVDEDTAEKLEESATVYPVEHETEYGPQPVAESPKEPGIEIPLEGDVVLPEQKQPKKSRDLTGPFTIPASLVEAELGFPLEPQPARDPRNAGTPIGSPIRNGRHEA